MPDLYDFDESPSEEWCYHAEAGWVVLDRDCSNGVSVFVRCRDWTDFEDAKSGWSRQTYRPCRLYISWLLTEESRDQATRQLLAYREEFLWRRKAIWTARAERLHKRARSEQVVPAGRPSSSRKFDQFFAELKGATEIRPFTKEWAVSDVLGWWTAEDQQLAERWLKGEVGEAAKHVARMQSARAAEKVALDFYRRFSLSVKDVSIRQLKERKGEWEWYDLTADRRRIDVKNARVPVNSRRTYVEHCVPRFKQVRGQDVKITGVVSPWMSPAEFESKTLRRDVVPFRLIGETDRTTAERLEDSFSALARQASTEIALGRTRHGSARFLPPWLFDYPEFVYRRRDQSREWLLGASEDQLPPLDDLSLMGLNALPAFLGARRPLPPTWLPLLSFSWQREFYEQVQRHPDPVSLPTLYLHLLLHFLMVSKSTAGHSDFAPECYRKLLYPDPASGRGPAGVVDPLWVICSLIDALGILWQHRHLIRLHDFRCFRFRGAGILSGWKKGTSDEIRILAYCGGLVPEKNNAACGYSPLLAGRETTCGECGYLICPECKSCKSGENPCPEIAKRRAMKMG